MTEKEAKSVKDVHKPEPRRGVIGAMENVFSPQPKTDAKAREQYMIKKYGLKKDPTVPNRYWIDDRRSITFIPGDEDSVSKAEEELDKHFRAPQIENADSDLKPVSPFIKKPGEKGSGGGAMAALREAADQIEPFARSANKASNDFLTGDLGFDEKKAEKALMSTDGIIPVQTPEFKDFMGEGDGAGVGSGKAPSSSKKKRTTKDRDDFGMSQLREPTDKDIFG